MTASSMKKDNEEEVWYHLSLPARFKQGEKKEKKHSAQEELGTNMKYLCIIITTNYL